METYKFFLITLFIVPFLIAQASVFVSYPITSTLTPVQPPVQYLDPDSTQVVTDISLTRTNATSIIFMSNVSQIVNNPDFFTGPDNWFCASTTSNLSCYWLPSDIGASGGVAEIYGYLSSIGSISIYRAYMFTNVTFPDSTISSISLQVTSGYWSEAGITFYVAGLYDPSSSTTVWSQTLSPTAFTYTTQYLSVPASSVTPGKTYELYIGLTVYLFWFSGGGTVDYRIDSVYLYVTTSDYVFSGAAIDINNTDVNTYYAHLTLDSANLDPSLNVNISLINMYGYSSTPIVIVNGSVVQDETSEISLYASQEGYTSGYVEVNANKSNNTNSTILLSFTYCTGPNETGVCVSYPLKLVLDPPSFVPREIFDHSLPRSANVGTTNINLKEMSISLVKVLPGARNG